MYTFGLNNEKGVEGKHSGRGKKGDYGQRHTIGNVKKFLGHCRKTMDSRDYLY